MKRIDFSNHRVFPGTTGNPFDVVVQKLGLIERLPGLVFVGLLFLMALIPNYSDWPRGLLLWAFMLLDWALISALPRFRKSFGPPKPPTFLLALLRMILVFLPGIYYLIGQLVGTVLVVYSFWIEPHKIQLTHQKLLTKKFKPGTSLRILHIADLHVERVTDRERQVNELVKTTQPDLILFSGDFLNLSYLHDPVTWQAAREVMAEWHAPLGAYAVLGSPAVDLPEVIEPLLEGLPVTLLGCNRLVLKHKGLEFDLIGLGCSHKPFIDAPLLLPILAPEKNRFTILLHHSPDLSMEVPPGFVDLHLAGHTHGGQVRLPLIGALFTGSLYGKKFTAGRYQIGDMILYISRGIGMEGASAPRLRFLTPPEVILWEISGQE